MDRFHSFESARFWHVRKTIHRDDCKKELDGAVSRWRSSGKTKNFAARVDVPDTSGCWTAGVAFFQETDPAEIDKPTVGEKTREFKYLFLLCHGGLLAAFSKGLDLSASFREKHLAAVPHDELARLVAQPEAVFQRVSMRNPLRTRYAMKAKSFQADDLSVVMPAATANRFVAGSFRVQTEQSKLTLTPGAGRVATQSQRRTWSELVAWAKTVINDLGVSPGRAGASPQPDRFLQLFARPQTVDDIRDLEPVSLFIDLDGLEDLFLGVEASHALGSTEDDGSATQNEKAVRLMLAALDQPLTPKGPPKELKTRKRIVFSGNAGKAIDVEVDLFKSKATIRSISIDGSEPFIDAKDDSAEGEPLGSLLNQLNLFSLGFKGNNQFYLDGGLFQIDDLEGQVDLLLARMKPVPGLSNATSEKGEKTLCASSVEFPEGSVFRVIVDEYAGADHLLICDDLGDEWADFLGFYNEEGRKTLKPLFPG
jgi:hypothetical protein